MVISYVVSLLETDMEKVIFQGHGVGIEDPKTLIMKTRERIDWPLAFSHRALVIVVK